MANSPVTEFNKILSSLKEKIIDYDTLKTQDMDILEDMIGTFRKLHDILRDLIEKRQNHSTELPAIRQLFAPCINNNLNDDDRRDILRSLYTHLIEYPYVINRRDSKKLSPVNRI